MSALTRFDRFDDLFPEMLRRFTNPTPLSGFEAPGEIRIDISDNDTGYEVRAEVPGTKKQASRRTLAIQ